MAGNDTLAKSQLKLNKKAPKNLSNLLLLFKTQQKDQIYIPMLAANSLLDSIRNQLSKDGCQLPLHIRWRHDILLDNVKVGQISLKNAKVQSQFYTQLSIQVSVKSIPKNFGAYDFQPGYLQKHIKRQIQLSDLAGQIISKLAMQLGDENGIEFRKEQIRKSYEKQLIYLGQKVTIYDRKYEHIHYTGKFIGVSEEGNALLEGNDKVFRDGYMKYNCEANDYLSLYR